MIAQLEKIIPTKDQSFFFRRFDVPYFDAPFHYHPEIELTYIMEGKGKRYVGEQVANFEPGDLVLIGPNVPHCWLCDTDLPLDTPNSISYVIQFTKNFLTRDGFSPVPEFEHLTDLLEKSASGLLIGGETRASVVQHLQAMPGLDTLGRLASWLTILTLLVESNDLLVLENEQRYDTMSSTNRDKLQKIYSHVINNYRNKISLDEVASLVNLSPNAFCRFFKQLTNKTLMEVIISYRVNHAVDLLKSTRLSVSEIAYESGFQTVPYFNAVFKKLFQCNPSDFRAYGILVPNAGPPVRVTLDD